MKRIFLLVLCVTSVCRPTAGAEPSDSLMDKFSIDRSRNIMRPENFGIANGKITTGIDCDDLLAIRGIWAPPFVSSDFTLQMSIGGQPVGKPEFLWRPFHMERSADLGDGVTAETTTVLIPEGRAFLVSIRLKNKGAESRSIPLAFTATGTLDSMLADSSWGFSAPQSSTATSISRLGEHSVALVQGDQAIVVDAGGELEWDSARGCFSGSVAIDPHGERAINFSFAVGARDDAVKQCDAVAGNPEAALARALGVYEQRVADLYQKMPRLESDNAALVHFYDRSLVPFLLNRWDVPEFKLKPFYSTGSVRGGCVGDYLWNVGECAEILSFFDPGAAKAHLRQFLETGVKSGFGFCPMNGGMLHPDYFYPINQEKVIGLAYHYVRNTGDVAFLNETMGGGTILDAILSEALYLDDLSKPAAMVDYGVCDPQGRGGQSHLELRTPAGALNYTNVMPDLNGRRYSNYRLAARLSELDGKPRPDLIERAEALKVALKAQLWDADKKWFACKMPDAVPPLSEIRYTVQMFYLLGSGVLDEEEESGLLSHLNENEFLSDYGMHSLAKQDPAYFPADVDNGGPGACTSFPLNIAKGLYLMGRPDLADEIVKRLLWWGESMPYWGDSFYADTKRYREETPLQCTIDSVAGAQCIIYGMFGIQPDFDGAIRIKPSAPSFATRLSLTGVKLRDHVFDVALNSGAFTVSYRGKTIEATIGHTVTIAGGGLALE